MIDNKKIEEAAINKCGFISSEFYSGAKWAINEFLKDLWHPVSDKPHGSFPILSEYEKGKYYVSYFDKNKDVWSNWRIIRWLNIDDLLPK
jgi:hypothetical protein